MAVKFGLTWWGKRWLDAFSNIDFSNRLPRGVIYVRRGAVSKLEVDGNVISAKVQGSRRRPYVVKITLPTFEEEKVERLIDSLIEHPALISKLLNFESLPEISSVAEGFGIHLFPKKRNDVRMRCDCSDHAVLCKHLAAVIYTISREIDNNPFLIFEMHKIDLIGELKKRGLATDDGKHSAPVLLSDILRNDKAKTTAEAPTAKALFAPIDYSVLPQLTDILHTFLEPEPAFYPNNDFRLLCYTHVAQAGKVANRLLEGVSTTDSWNVTLMNIDKRTDLRIVIDDSLNVTVRHSDTKEKTVYDEADLFCALMRLPPDSLPSSQHSVIALYEAARCALQLLARGACVPQIVTLSRGRFSIRWLPSIFDINVRKETLSKGKYAIRWLPAMLDANVWKVMEKLSTKIPQEVVTMQIGREKAPLGNPAEWLVSIFLTILISKLTKQQTESIGQLFFKKGPVDFSGVGRQETPIGVKAWLARLHIEQSRFAPVFAVDETATEGEFILNIGIVDKEKSVDTTIPLSDILEQDRYRNVRFDALRNISLLSQKVPQIDGYIDGGGKEPIPLSGDRMVDFLLQAMPFIRLLQARVILPSSLKTLVRPQITVALKKRTGYSKTFIRLDELLKFDWRVALGNETVIPQEFEELAAKFKGLVYFKGQYICVSAGDIERIRRSQSKRNDLTPGQMLQTAFSGELAGIPILMSDEVRQLIAQFTDEQIEEIPDTLNATLRPYQQRGFSWMYRNMRIGFGSIMADDMGLGKTIQVITLILKMKEEGMLENNNVLVIVPAGLLANWQAELERFAPSLSSHIYHGPVRDIKEATADVIITSYGMARSDVNLLKEKKWELLIIDEAQNIKNHATALSKAVRAIEATTRIALSGTPVENRLSEFWSIMDFVNHGYLGSAKAFEDVYAKPIQNTGDQFAVQRFRKITAPFLMRRLKSDKSIISDLPDKIELNKFAQLTAAQASLYHETVQKAMAEIVGVTETDSQSLFQRQGLVLQMILALKQICNHPAQFLKDGRIDPALSGKTEMLLDLVETIVAGNEKVLIFTQFRDMGDMLCQFIQERIGESPLFYHGGCSLKQRNDIVQRFQENPADQILVLSLKAAGTGLNLTAALHVIHYDLWWNPAVEAQATDRAYRIGQIKNVMVHRFITKETFEEKIDKMIQEKRQLADLTVSTGESWIGKLSNEELKELFG